MAVAPFGPSRKARHVPPAGGGLRRRKRAQHSGAWTAASLPSKKGDAYLQGPQGLGFLLEGLAQTLSHEPSQSFAYSNRPDVVSTFWDGKKGRPSQMRS